METQVYVPYSPTSGRSSYDITLKRMSDPKERFYRHFQNEITSIQDQIEDLATLSPINGERQDCNDGILTSISRLSNEVTDALDYIPAYDQRAYGQAIKALTEKLNEATGKFAPKSRFRFKPQAPKTDGDSSAQNDPRQLRTAQSAFHDIKGTPPPPGQHAARHTNDEETEEGRDSVGTLPSQKPSKNYNEEMSRPGASGVRKPSFSTARNIAIYAQAGLHIILPSSAARATSSGSLADLQRCVVDMTVPTTGASSSASPFAGLTVRDVRQSLLICGTVAGAVHITGVRDSVVVVAARQVRVHECKNVKFYLHCASHPIIEDCKNMWFAPLPEVYGNHIDEPSKNQWDQVDDFKWLKTEPSPNWSILPTEQRLPTEVWTKYVCGSASLSTDDILRKVGALD